MPESRNRWHQTMPSPAWQIVRQLFPGRSAVLVVDEEANTREFLLLQPVADYADMALDGLTLSAAEAEERLAKVPTQPLPTYLQQDLRRLWATES